MKSCNVGIRTIPRPFGYEINDTENREYSRFENYAEETYRKLNSQVEDMIDDGGTAVEND
jgi:hypothetical protein